VDVYGVLRKVRAQSPLVHHLTNWVTIYDCANIVKVFGASPIMAHDRDEVADMAGLANALVLNIGTLTSELVESMKIAARAANKKGIPVVLDACGAGASKLRDDKSFELLSEARISILRGNSSEIARIAGEKVRTKGVDATEVEADLTKLAAVLARQRQCTVVITGKEDIVSDGHKALLVKNGCDMMSKIVGTGCMATSVIGAFAAVEPDLAGAAAAGLCCFEIAAELAAQDCRGPGTFKERLFDYAYNLNEDQVRRMQKVSVGKG
jgi:hydroxyethylthiazole kinase